MEPERTKRENLIKLRTDMQITQEQVADEIGINRSHYGLIETGIRNPSFDVATKIAKFFNKEMEEIFDKEIFFAGRCYVEKHNEQPTEQNQETA